jgi:hypothetical protein
MRLNVTLTSMIAASAVFLGCTKSPSSGNILSDYEVDAAACTVETKAGQLFNFRDSTVRLTGYTENLYDPSLGQWHPLTLEEGKEEPLGILDAYKQLPDGSCPKPVFQRVPKQEPRVNLNFPT